MADQLYVEVVLEGLKLVALVDFYLKTDSNSHDDPQMKFLKMKLGIIVRIRYNHKYK